MSGLSLFHVFVGSIMWAHMVHVFRFPGLYYARRRAANPQIEEQVAYRGWKNTMLWDAVLGALNLYFALIS